MSEHESIVEGTQLAATASAARDRIEELRAENEQLREAQEQRETAAERNAELFDSAPVPYMTIDQNGFIHRANAKASSLLGREQGQLVGSSLLARVAAFDRRRFLDYLAVCRDRSGDFSCDVKLMSGAGTGVPVRLSSRPLPSTGMRALTVLDMTERDQAVIERDRLRDVVHQARAASEARDNFIAILSHELRAPLTPVLAATSALLSKSEVQPEIRQLFGMIARNVEAERRLIDDLLDTTRIGHGKLRVERKSLDLHRVLAETVDMLMPEIHRKRLVIVTDLGAERAWVCADGGRMHQVFWNLLQNAIKFTDEGGRIDVRSWNRGSALAIEIRDNGQGIAPAVLPKLFAPFQQAPESRASNRAGLGLGLTICRGVVELHDGEISVVSAGLGKGARFIVDLPTIATREEQTGVSLSSAATSAGAPPHPRILLVEDDVDTCQTLAGLLRGEGFEVRVANSVSEALRLGVDDIDVVLSDIGLGDGTGLELMRALRKVRPVKGIALSGYGTESDIIASEKAGFSAHLVKPVTLDKLVAAIVRTAPPSAP